MNDTRLSASVNKLLAAARADTPNAAARTKVWSGVSSAVGGAAAVAGGTATSALVAGGASATKLLAVGALFGGSLAVGLATVLLHVGPTPTTPRTTADPALEAASAPSALSAGVQSIWTRTPSPSLGVGPAEVATATPPAAVRAAAPHAKRAIHEDMLAREASLVAEARGALARSDPRTALRAIRSARALPSRQLVPEELAVEEQALRALGRSDEANGIDVQLRLQYPEAALAR